MCLCRLHLSALLPRILFDCTRRTYSGITLSSHPEFLPSSHKRDPFKRSPISERSLILRRALEKSSLHCVGEPALLAEIFKAPPVLLDGNLNTPTAASRRRVGSARGFKDRLPISAPNFSHSLIPQPQTQLQPEAQSQESSTWIDFDPAKRTPDPIPFQVLCLLPSCLSDFSSICMAFLRENGGGRPLGY